MSDPAVDEIRRYVANTGPDPDRDHNRDPVADVRLLLHRLDQVTQERNRWFDRQQEAEALADRRLRRAQEAEDRLAKANQEHGALLHQYMRLGVQKEDLDSENEVLRSRLAQTQADLETSRQERHKSARLDWESRVRLAEANQHIRNWIETGAIRLYDAEETDPEKWRWVCDYCASEPVPADQEVQHDQDCAWQKALSWVQQGRAGQ